MLLFQVDKNSPLSNDCTPVIEEGVGQNLFTFSSETASLIKFLTVASVSNQHLMTAPSANCKVKDVTMTTEDDRSGRGCLDCKAIQNKQQRPAPKNNVCQKTFNKDRNVGINSEQCKPCVSYASAKVENRESSSSVVTGDTSPKNLIFVTGEFAVALHQLGIKNVSTESLSKSTPSPNEESMEVSEESHHMVVNFSNNDIHVQPFRKSDKPDHLIDLFGHVTGLCLSRDNRQVWIIKQNILFVRYSIYHFRRNFNGGRI